MHRLLLRGSRMVAAATAAIALLTSCVPMVRESDNGDWSFARQVFPILYGRKARGHDELKVVVDMTRRVGREATLRGMMDRPEFVEHWTEVMVNHMKASKETPGLFGDQQSQRACFPQAVATAGNSSELARWIRDNGPEAGPARCGAGACGSFTMTDVVRSSLMLDDLSPAYRAYLFSLQSKPIAGAQANEANQRSSLFKRFESVYLHRRNECLTCHNAFASVTGASSQWNRMHPLPMYMEQAVYGNNAGRSNERELHAPFRVTGVNSGAIAPWGMQSCGSFSRPANDDPESTGIGFLTRDLGRRSSIFDVEALLDRGVRNLRNGLARCTSSPVMAGLTCTSCTSGIEPTPTAAQIAAENDVRSLFTSAGCFGCHSGGAGGLTMTATNFASALVRAPSTGDPTKARVNPRCASGSEAGCGGRGSHLMERLTSATAGFRMPPAGVAFTAAQLDTVRNWINGLPANAGCGGSICSAAVASCNTNPLNGAYVHGDDALAMMTAASIVDMVWTEVMGYPLTIDLYHPRNEAQRNILWNLTEYNFVNKQWSLREVLVRVLLFDYFNRRAPATGDGIATSGGATSPYELPLMFNPWAEGDPRRPPIAQPGWTAGSVPTPDPAYDRNAPANRSRHYDPMSEAVHRYGARSLLNSAATALDWTRPQRFYPNAYPSKALGLAMGDYWRDTEPGFRGTSFTSLLSWEFTHGRCEKPAGVATDWVDRLMAAIAGFDAANPGSELKVEDLARTIKDWLLNDSTLTGAVPTGLTVTEAQALEALFGAPVASRAAGIADLAGKSRRFCGMLLNTPQFMLAGLEPPPGPGPRPRLRVCNGGDCSYQQICSTLRPSIVRQRVPDFLCGTDGLADPFKLPDRFYEWVDPIRLICRRGPCEVVSLPPGCRPGLGRCPLPPICDPRIDGCGGPLPPIELAHQVRNGRVLTLPIDAPAIKDLLGGKGVRHVRGEQSLRTGTDALPGDWLVLEPGAALGGWFDRVTVPKRSDGEQLGIDGIVILVRDAAPSSVLGHRLPDYVFPRDEVERRLREPALRFGSGGQPIGEPQPFDPRENDARNQLQRSRQ